MDPWNKLGLNLSKTNDKMMSDLYIVYIYICICIGIGIGTGIGIGIGIVLYCNYCMYVC